MLHKPCPQVSRHRADICLILHDTNTAVVIGTHQHNRALTCVSDHIYCVTWLATCFKRVASLALSIACACQLRSIICLCLSVCLSVCQSVCLSVCLCVCLSGWLAGWLSVFYVICLPAFLTATRPSGGQAVMQGVLAEALQPLTQAAEQAASSLAPENTSDSSSLLASLSIPCAKLQSVMSGLAMTHAHVLLHRAPDVGAFASQLKVSNMSLPRTASVSQSAANCMLFAH